MIIPILILWEDRIAGSSVWRVRADYVTDHQAGKWYGARFTAEDEGITWCRGHTGPAADALRVTAALRNT